jgi:hypothetical protein
VLAQFPVEAGYFNKKEAIIPDCPLKMTIFGPTRIVREDRVFEKLLNSYIKELPGMPKSIVKCELINNFFALRGSDIAEPGTKPTRATKPRRKNAPVVVSKLDNVLTQNFTLLVFLTTYMYVHIWVMG